MVFKPDLEVVILSVLKEGALHGYAIAREVERLTEKEISIPEGRLYPVLHKMQDKGWLATEWFHVDGKASRRLYSLTESGVEVLGSKKMAWGKFRGAIDRVLGGGA